MPHKPVTTEDINSIKVDGSVVTKAEEVVNAVVDDLPPVEEPTKPTFDPTKHLSKVSGREYLEVKWRLVWVRDVHPNVTIDTELIQYRENEAVFKATITLPNGVYATGWGSETKAGFGDYLEKAETKAIGRALGALGFGTQFSNDFEFGADKGKVVDAPVSRPQGRSQPQAPRLAPPPPPSDIPPPNSPGGEYVCEEPGCGIILADGVKATGQPFPAAEKAAQSLRYLGRILCASHAADAKKAKVMGAA